MDELISRQAAIDAFGLSEKTRKYGGDRSGYDTRMLYEIQDVLEDLPSVQPDVPDINVGDMISRQQAISRAVEIRMFDRPVKMVAVSELERLPSAEPERKKGRWVYNSPVTMKCNQCGLVIKDWDWHRFKYCPNCISDMRGE